MLFQRVNRTNPEKIFLVAKNSYSTASLTNGQAVIWDWTTDKDGVGVTLATATVDISVGIDVAGIASETIGPGDYGLLQVYGYHSAVRVRRLTSTGHIYDESTADVAVGTPLVGGVSTVFCLEGISSVVSAQNLHPCAFALAATTLFTTTTMAVFLKCL